MSELMVNKTHSSGLRWLWVTLIVLLLDRITKYAAQAYLIPYDPVHVMPFFNLTLAYNKGAAFSFLNNFSGWQTWFLGTVAVVVSSALLYWLHQIPSQQRFRSIALALIIGGALGNLWDRTLYGHVIDFIEVYASRWHFPVFNVADSAICIGAFMLLLEASFSRKRTD